MANICSGELSFNCCCCCCCCLIISGSLYVLLYFVLFCHRLTRRIGDWKELLKTMHSIGLSPEIISAILPGSETFYQISRISLWFEQFFFFSNICTTAHICIYIHIFISWDVFYKYSQSLPILTLAEP